MVYGSSERCRIPSAHCHQGFRLRVLSDPSLKLPAAAGAARAPPSGEAAGAPAPAPKEKLPVAGVAAEAAAGGAAAAWRYSGDRRLELKLLAGDFKLIFWEAVDGAELPGLKLLAGDLELLETKPLASAAPLDVANFGDDFGDLGVQLGRAVPMLGSFPTGRRGLGLRILADVGAALTNMMINLFGLSALSASESGELPVGDSTFCIAASSAPLLHLLPQAPAASWSFSRWISFRNSRRCTSFRSSLIWAAPGECAAF